MNASVDRQATPARVATRRTARGPFSSARCDLRSVPVERLASRARGPRIEEEYSLDENGIVAVTIKNLESELERALRVSFTDLSCKADGDCAIARFHCACAGVMARRMKPKYEALTAAYEKNNCFNQGPPRPCASCRPPPTPRCKAGKCFGQYP